MRELARRDWRRVRSAAREPRTEYDLVRLKPGSNIADPNLLSRAQGCLLGQLAGDSLGSLVEFSAAAAVARQYPHGPRQLEDGGTFGTIAGQPTDDSEMALLLARSMLRAGRYDPDAAAQAYLHWYNSDPFDCGNTVARAIRWRQSRTPGEPGPPTGESQANGSLMRISPLGIWGHDAAPEQVAKWARADASLTHPHPVCLEANALYTVVLARAVAKGETPGGLYRYATEWAGENCREKPVAAALAEAAERAPDYQRNAGWVLIALQNAFYQLLHAGSLEEGLVETVRGGGDTDTNAAIAGALLGAVYGREAVPAQWQRMVLSCRPLAGLPNVRCPRQRDFWPVDALALAERLLLHE